MTSDNSSCICGSCCCPTSLRIRVKIIAVVFFLIAAFQVIGMCISPQEIRYGSTYIYAVVTQVLFMITGIWLYAAAINGSVKLSIPWLVLACINLIGYLVAFFLILASLVAGVDPGLKFNFIGGMVGFLFSLIVLAWSVWTVIQFVLSIRRGEAVDYEPIDGAYSRSPRPRASPRPVDSLKRFRKPYDTESDL